MLNFDQKSNYYMKRIIILCIGFIALNIHLYGIKAQLEARFDFATENKDSLPTILPKNHADIIGNKLRLDAAIKFAENPLPSTLKDWETFKGKLKREILNKTAVVINHDLPLNIRETSTIQLHGYKIKNIYFQTRPGIYATANLYIPDGKGPFPGVIFMIGHWPKGKIDTSGPQAVGHSLALNGYVCLSIDPWGSGERTTVHGIFEDHGDANNLGSSLMNIGEAIMGIEISDNMRGVDLLCSLPFVDSKNIGATGASGGGNQTMWLAALDERVKAAMPVVSVGTFESYIMGTPCICEVVVDALNFSEEAGIISLVAPRAIKMCNHLKDDNHAFFPAEMIRTFNNAKSIFKMYGVENNITYQLFDLPHGYMAADREAVLGWFDLHLKHTGAGTQKMEIPFEQLPEEKLMVFPIGKRDTNIVGTEVYCKRRGNELRMAFLQNKTFDLPSKREELRQILGVNEKYQLNNVYQYSKANDWQRLALETSDNKLIPLLLRIPADNSGDFVILANPGGKDKISADLLDRIMKSGKGIAIADLSGTGEASSPGINNNYTNGMLRSVSRSELWFGRTVIGEWVKELNMVNKFLRSNYNAKKVEIEGYREAGLAGLFLSAVEGNIDSIILRDAPISYLFDNRESVDYFSMAINLPGFLNWGDISLVAALSGKNVTFISPVTMSGRKISENRLKEYQAEFENIKTLCKQSGKTLFK
jgi:hypothetical protein